MSGTTQINLPAKTATITVNKAANPMKVTAATKTFKKSAIAKKAKTVKAVTVTNAKGKVTYKKVSGSKYITVNKTTGKITMKKHKCSKSTKSYSVKIKVTAAGNDDYKSASKTVTVKVKMK